VTHRRIERPDVVDRRLLGAGGAGFSLIEVLFTSLLVLAVAVSTVPMFTRGLVSNTAGMDATEVSNQARTHLERLIELPFASPELTVTEGTELRSSDWFSTVTGQWQPFPTPVASAAVQWTRVTSVRQYGLAALADGVIEQSEALDAGVEPQWVHMKQIEVLVEQTGAAFGGPAKRISVGTLKVK
jgi:hypothetical protein